MPPKSAPKPSPNPAPNPARNRITWHPPYFFHFRALQLALCLANIYFSWELKAANPSLPSILTFAISCLLTRHTFYDLWRLRPRNRVFASAAKTVQDETVLFSMLFAANAAGVVMYGGVLMGGCAGLREGGVSGGQGFPETEEACKLAGWGVVVGGALMVTFLPTIWMAVKAKEKKAGKGM